MAWIWFCTYDKGHGVDREVCGAKYRKRHKTRKSAYANGLRHARHPVGWVRSHEGYVVVREVDREVDGSEDIRI